MTNRSKRANHFGTAVEKRMAEKNSFEIARSSWHDARYQNGTPVEIKSAMVEHSDGSEGTFKLYREYHEKLVQSGGCYCFAAYKPWGSGVRIVADKIVQPRSLPLLRWHGGGDHRGTQQAKIRISDLF